MNLLASVPKWLIYNTIAYNFLCIFQLFYSVTFLKIKNIYIIRSRFVLRIVHSVTTLDDTILLIQFNTSVGAIFFLLKNDHSMSMESRLKTVSSAVIIDILIRENHVSPTMTTKRQPRLVSSKECRAKWFITVINNMIFILRQTPYICNTTWLHSPIQFLGLFQNNSYESKARPKLSAAGRTRVSNWKVVSDVIFFFQSTITQFDLLEENKFWNSSYLWSSSFLLSVRSLTTI